MGTETSKLIAHLSVLYGERLAAFADLLIGDSDDWHWAQLLVNGWKADDPYWQLLPVRANFDPEKFLGVSEDKYGWHRRNMWQLLARCRREDWAWLLQEITEHVEGAENRWVVAGRVKDLASAYPTPERKDLLRWIAEVRARVPERFGA